MALSPILAVSFNLVTGKFNFTDSTNIGALTPGNVEGILTIQGPDGVIYHQGAYGTPDIDFGVALTNNTINIPKDARGNFLRGIYTITYQIQVFAPDPPEIATATYAIDYCNEAPATVFGWNIDCLRKPVVSVVDLTPYDTWTINSRTITLNPPAERNLPGYATVSAADRDIDSDNDAVWTGRWGAKITAQIQKVYPTHTVVFNISEVDYKDVRCLTACTVYCCLKTKWNRVEKSTSPTEKAIHWGQFNEMVSLAAMINIAENCGESNEVDSLIKELKLIGNCSDCDDCGNTDSLIDPTAYGGATTYTFQAGAGLLVTVNGTTVTYSINAANAAILANIFNSVVAAGSGITVTPVTTTVNGVTTVTYTVALAAGVPTAYPKLYEGIMRIQFFAAGAPVVPSTITVIEENNFATSRFNAMNTWTLTAQPGGATINHEAVLRLGGFINGPNVNDTWVMGIQRVGEGTHVRTNATGPMPVLFNRNPTTGEYDFKLIEGGNVTFADIGNTFSYIEFLVTITER